MSALFLSHGGHPLAPNRRSRDALIRGGPAGQKLEWPIGNNIIHDNGADRVMFWGRLPFILLGGAVGRADLLVGA